MRRPAGPAVRGRDRGVLRRPAAHPGEEGVRGERTLEWDPAVGDLILAEGAHYYGTPCRFTGQVLEDTRDPAGRQMSVRLHGTDHEPLLTWATGTTAAAKVHMCPEGCGRPRPARPEVVGGDLRSPMEGRPFGPGEVEQLYRSPCLNGSIDHLSRVSWSKHTWVLIHEWE